MSSIDSWLDLVSKKKRNCLSWSMSMVYPRIFSKRWSFWLLAHFWMHFIMPASLNPNKKEKHVSRTSQQVEHPTRSYQSTPISRRTLLSRPCQSLIIKTRTFRKTRGITTNKILPGNGVIITIQHGMIRQNAKLRRIFWKNCQHPTYPTEPW